MLTLSKITTAVCNTYPNGELTMKWREFLSSADFGMHYTAPEFFHEPKFRQLRPFAVLSFQDGKITGVLSGVVDINTLRSGQSVSPQLSIAPGIDRDSTLSALVEALKSAMTSVELVIIFTWQKEPALQQAGFRCREQQGVVLLNLSKGPEHLIKDLANRQNINKAVKSGVEVTLTAEQDDINDYYRVYRVWSGKKGLSVMSQEAFQETFSLTGNRGLFVARYQGKIIAGSVVRFHAGGLLEYAANSSLDEFRHLRPNDLIMWRIMEWGSLAGFQRYSLGGAHPFLRKFGGEVIPTYRYQLDKTVCRSHDLIDCLHYTGLKIWNKLPANVRNKLKNR